MAKRRKKRVRSKVKVVKTPKPPAPKEFNYGGLIDDNTGSICMFSGRITYGGNRNSPMTPSARASLVLGDCSRTIRLHFNLEHYEFGEGEMARVRAKLDGIRDALDCCDEYLDAAEEAYLKSRSADNL
ncbi:MAG: hypothetical protein AB7V18_19585 [Pyrinomonadaceae bacterium]